jgi:hypothetical protein
MLSHDPIDPNGMIVSDTYGPSSSSKDYSSNPVIPPLLPPPPLPQQQQHLTEQEIIYNIAEQLKHYPPRE